ncbi:MAG: serine protease, partial [Alphaproteobacteria bacterium]
EVVGEVLRTDKVRDVALVKVPVRIRTALPIRKKLATRLEKVYVIGTPLKESLGSTITAGVVSALRTDLKTGQILIQSDAPITGGNSGGALLDEYGNVIGISVLSYIHGQNLNLFIPIGEALERLNIEIRPKDKIHRVVARPAFPLDLKALLATWMGPAVAAGRSTEYGYI